MTIDRAAPRRRRAPARAPAPRRRGIFAILGPGLITGASDDDPSGIATYSQAGAQFGTGLVWSLLFTYPLMVCIQEISGRIGRVTGRGIAGNLCRNYPLPVVYAIVGLLFLANIINLGADLGAMAASLQLLIGGPRLLFVFLFGVGSALLQVFIDYSRYASLLKWLCLSLFSYVATVFVVDVPWGQVLHDVVVPHVTLDNAELTVLVAVFGTTISPYLFFWQASEEVEEIKEDPKAKPLKQAEEQAPAEFERIRLDTYAGMAFSNIVALFIMVTTAATLHAHGTTDIQTSADAAQALRPIAGDFAFALFALGIIGTGLLAVPVLAGSAAYALAETCHWPAGLGKKPSRAKAFYATIAGATALGILVNLSTLDPMKALFWSAVINGIVAVPVMVMMMLMTAHRSVMGDFTLPPVLRIGGWLATAVMALAAAAMLVT
jgi:NRAMP (natural resistance-associated macrophage protein)-like metal ion transporter